MHCMNLEKICHTIQESDNKFYREWHPFMILFKKTTTVDFEQPCVYVPINTQYLLCFSIEDNTVPLCQQSRWTVQPLHRCHLYYLRDCDTSVPRGMGTKEESYHTPPDLPLV